MKTFIKYFTKKNIITALSLIVFAVISRLFIHGYNVETLTATTVLAGALLGPYLGLTVGLLSIIGSDVLIGNEIILAYTWSAWAVIGAGNALWLKRVRRWAIWKSIIGLTGSGVVSTIFFYLWTNFGVWQLGWYAHTWQGLIQCYIAGLPFLRNQLLGNIVIVPIVVAIGTLAYRYLPVIITNLWKLKRLSPKIH